MDKQEFEYLGPYKVEGILGRGGMGTVYKGRHARSGELVAIKVIAPSVANQMRFRRRFAAEVETITRLTHPNIVKAIGFGEEQGLLFTRWNSSTVTRCKITCVSTSDWIGPRSSRLGSM